MDVVVSVLGTSFLRGSMVKYRLEGDGTICASTPAIPILVSLIRNMQKGNGGADPPTENPPGLVLIVPHSLLATGIDYTGLTWDELDRWNELNADKGPFNFNGFITEKLSQLMEYIRDSLGGENGEIARTGPDSMDEELNEALSLALKFLRGALTDESWRLTMVLVQSIGSFPVPYLKMSTEERTIYGSLTLRGSALDPFTRIYLALKDMWIKGGRGEFTVHFDVSSGMNVVTVSALLGARAFSIVHGAALKIYNTDPYIPEIAAHCEGLAVEIKGRSFRSVGAPPLGVAEIGELMSTIMLVEEISSIPKGGTWDLSLEEAKSLMKDIREELNSFIGGREEETPDEWVELIEALLGHVRRLSCGLRNTAVTYIHRELSNLQDPVRKVYGENGLYVNLREELERHMYLDQWDETLRVFSGPPEKSTGGGVTLTYAWSTGPTLVLLDAIASLATDIYSDIDLLERSTGFPIRGEFHSGILEGRGVTPDFLISLAGFYLRKGLNLNLVFMLGELEFEDESIEEILNLMKPINVMPEDLKNSFMRRFAEYVREKICRLQHSKNEKKEREMRREWSELLKIHEQVYRSTDRSEFTSKSLGLFRTYFLIKALSNNLKGSPDYINRFYDFLGRVEKSESDLETGSRCVEFVKEILENEILENIMKNGWDIDHFHRIIKKYSDEDELSHLTRCLMKFIAENKGGLGDLLIHIAQDKGHSRFEKFLDSIALSFGSEMNYRKVTSLVRNFLAHLGLTHFSVTDIVPADGSVEVLYDSQLLERLDESSRLGALGSMCDISSRRS